MNHGSSSVTKLRWLIGVLGATCWLCSRNFGSNLRKVFAVSNLVVAKIGGTSMSQFIKVLEGIIEPNGKGFVYVMSAYAGVTNLLLENKKNHSEGGIYALFASEQDWRTKLEDLRAKLMAINQTYAEFLDVDEANEFIAQRLARTKNYLEHMQEVIASGYVNDRELLFAARELLASIGESHSVYNSYLILRKRGIPVLHFDLSGEDNPGDRLGIDERIQRALAGRDLTNCISLVTGYVKGTEGIMREFDRGYSEVTFSKVCVKLQPKEAIIYKEFHLSSGDPNIIGSQVRVIGNTNYDVADQLADIRMEAIHPKASKPLERSGIKIRLANTFEPDHPGTLISKEFCSDKPRVEIISGVDSAKLLTVHDTCMVGEVGFDLRIMQYLDIHGVSYVSKATNANTIEMVICDALEESLINDLQNKFEAVVVKDVALVCVMGSNMKIPGITEQCVRALAQRQINLLGISQTSRQVNIQFVVECSDYQSALLALHSALIEV